MRRAGLVIAGIVGVALVAAAGWQTRLAGRAISAGATPGQPAVPTKLRVAFEAQLDSVLTTFDTLAYAVRQPSLANAQRAFRHARRQYKRAECLLEFYSPSTTALVNGPPLENDGDAPIRPLGEPAAFQRVENVLFEKGDSAAEHMATDTVTADIVFMRNTLAAFREQTKLLRIIDADFLDAARLEVARISTLGIVGFDAGASGSAIVEQAESMDGMRSLARVAFSDDSRTVSRDRWTAIDTTLKRASNYLNSSADFDSFDRFAFLTSFAAPVASAVATARSSSPVAMPLLRRAWRTKAASVFDENAFDAWAYARETFPEYSGDSTSFGVTHLRNERIALGKQLFFDPQLSGPATRSCASCHVPERAFADGQKQSVTFAAPAAKTATNGVAGAEGLHPAVRNVPTLLNAALQPEQFADERAGSLEQQIGMVLASADEMRSSAKLAALRVSGNASYRADFKRLWNERAGVRGDTVTDDALLIALAAYVRSLTAMNSRFDRAMRGDSLALTAEEKFGFNLFTGKARCATCHFAPLFNGAAPPAYASSEPEIINVPGANVTEHARVDGDLGRARIDGLPEHRFAFKVPSVRNVALTSPYMHNGVFSTLEQVVDFYNRGGGVGIGIASSAQTLASTPLHLSSQEQSALVAFLRSLTDSTLVTQRPHSVTGH